MHVRTQRGTNMHIQIKRHTHAYMQTHKWTHTSIHILLHNYIHCYAFPRLLPNPNLPDGDLNYLTVRMYFFIFGLLNLLYSTLPQYLSGLRCGLCSNKKNITSYWVSVHTHMRALSSTSTYGHININAPT